MRRGEAENNFLKQFAAYGLTATTAEICALSPGLLGAGSVTPLRPRRNDLGRSDERGHLRCLRIYSSYDLANLAWFRTLAHRSLCAASHGSVLVRALCLFPGARLTDGVTLR